MNRAIGILSVIAAIVVILCIITWNNNRMMELQNNSNMMVNSSEDSSNTKKDEVSEVETEEEKEKEVEPQPTTQTNSSDNLKVFNLITEETETEIAKGVILPTWTYGGTVPGTEIRVTEGDLVQVNVTNNLEVPITIHWHGYPVTSDMDGIPGLTQDAILPGQTFTYEFPADVTGTYWYHSHQESSKQVDMGLYGALIVEPKDQQVVDKDYTFILDEWMENSEEAMTMSDDNSEMSGMEGMGGMESTDSVMEEMGGTDPELLEEEMMKELYNIYTVNGKSGELIQPIEVEQGDIVRLRFINAGYRTHGIHIPEEMIKVVSTDGQDIKGAEEFLNQIIEIAPGERYDIEFKVQSEDDFVIDFHDDNLYNEQLNIPVKVLDGSGAVIQEDQDQELPYFDLTSYGSYLKGELSLEQKYDIDQYIELNTDAANGSLKYTINGETYQELQPITVKTDDYIKLTYVNKSQVDHPMHLHGHFFEVLSKNDNPLTGAPIVKDTLLIKPGEKFVIAFKADNPGNWIYHCHELHHAAGGMMQKVVYSDYVSDYIPDPNNEFNRPE
ncbi:MAG: hypothetical protein K0R34_2929 [Herbinix sp.]|nr:hypothetical protein [Herbinix sp.]